MKVTVTDVARRARSSVGTVSSVLNGKTGARRISEATALRIRQAAEELGYVPNYFAKGLRTRQTSNLGLLVNLSIQHSYLIDVITHVEKHAKRRNYHVNIGMVRDERDVEHYVRSFGASRCDAVVVASVAMNETTDRRLAELTDGGVRVVLVYCGEHAGYDCVFPDTGRSGVLATDHLIRKGHRRIVVVGHAYRDGSPCHRYLMGMREALDRHGVLFDPQLSFTCPADFEAGRALWAQIASRVDGCNGIIAYNDDVALGLARGAKDASLRLPEDLRIVAQNNTYPVRISDPPLTSTQYDLNRVAEAAIEMALDGPAISGPGQANRPVRMERITPLLIER